MEIITMILAAILVNNVALSAFAGADVLTLSTKKAINTKTLCLATIVVVTISGLLNAVVATVLPTNFMYLYTLISVIVILVVATLVENYTSLKLGKFAVLVVLNSVALSVALANSTAGNSILNSTLIALGSGVGYAMAFQVFKAIRKDINDKYVPESFKGLPVDLLIIAIMAMAVTCFK